MNGAPPDCNDAGWTSDPCIDDAGWSGATVCRRPYSLGSYGGGPYGRCQIIGMIIWGTNIGLPVFNADTPCAPFVAQAPLPPMPWRRRHG